MRSIETRVIESLKVPITALMEAAGLNVADAVLELLEDLPEPKVALLCGKGNNGGDGLVAAKYLTAEGYSFWARKIRLEAMRWLI